MNNIKFVVVPENELKALLSDALREELAKVTKEPIEKMKSIST